MVRKGIQRRRHGPQNFSRNRQEQGHYVQDRGRTDQGRIANRTGSRNQIDPRHPPRPERGTATGAHVACLRSLRRDDDADKRHLRETLVGVLGVREVSVTTYEPHHPWPKPCGDHAVRYQRRGTRSVSQRWRAARQQCNGEKSFLTVKQAAETSGLGASTIRLAIRKRQLRAQKVGRRVLVKRIDLKVFCRRIRSRQ